MVPAGPLIIEHRFIERMVDLFVADEERINQQCVAGTDLLPVKSLFIGSTEI